MDWASILDFLIRNQSLIIVAIASIAGFFIGKKLIRWY